MSRKSWRFGPTLVSGAIVGVAFCVTAAAEGAPPTPSASASSAPGSQLPPPKLPTVCSLPWNSVAPDIPEPEASVIRVGKSSYQVGGRVLVSAAPFPASPKFTQVADLNAYALEGAFPPLAIVKDRALYSTYAGDGALRAVRQLATLGSHPRPTWAFEIPNIGVVAGDRQHILFAKYGEELALLEKHKGQPDLPDFTPTPPYGGFLVSPREEGGERGQKVWWVGASPALVGLFKSAAPFSRGLFTQSSDGLLSMVLVSKDGPEKKATVPLAKSRPVLALEKGERVFLLTDAGVSEVSVTASGTLQLTLRLAALGGIDAKTGKTGWFTARKLGTGKAVLQSLFDAEVVDVEGSDQPTIISSDDDVRRLRGSRDVYPLPDFGSLRRLGSTMGFDVTVPWPRAQVSFPDFEGKTPEVSKLGQVVIRLEHPCIGQNTTLKLRGEAPDGSPLQPREQSVALAFVKKGVADATVVLRPFQSKAWKLQFVNLNGKQSQEVGPPLEVRVAPKNSGIEDYVKWGGYALGALLAVANFLVLALARYSATAWRIATSSSNATLVVRLVSLLLSHARPVQLWVLDRYFQHEKEATRPPANILALPLANSQRRTVKSTELLQPPWVVDVGPRRIAIVGATGMGKTTLMHWLRDSYFTRSQTSFDAAKHDQVVMAFIKARQFDGKTYPEGEANERWVVEALRGTLAPSGLSFEDTNLLRLMLRTGSIGVVIDGLHEAGSRVPAVNAFAREFPRAPVVVTMQTLPEMPSFEVWKLPVTMVEHAAELLALLLENPTLAHAADQAISASGLKATLLSGYDVRLIQQLADARGGAENFPFTRADLYEAAWQAAWHDDPRAPEEQAVLRALAWKVTVSRDAHQQRLLSDKDPTLPLKLLEKLSAEVPDGDSRTRIIVRVDGGYEFVHDQMVAYLAAMYLVHTGYDAKGLVRLLDESRLEARPPAEMRPLWFFLAIVLPREARDELLRELTPAGMTDADRWGVLRHVLAAQARAEDSTPGRLPPLG